MGTLYSDKASYITGDKEETMRIWQGTKTTYTHKHKRHDRFKKNRNSRMKNIVKPRIQMNRFNPLDTATRKLMTKTEENIQTAGFNNNKRSKKTMELHLQDAGEEMPTYNFI